MTQWHGGKGDTPRTGTYSKQYKDNWDKIFSKKKKETITEHSTYFDSEFEEESRERYGDNMPDIGEDNA